MWPTLYHFASPTASRTWGGLMLDVKQLYELQVLDLKLAELEQSVSEILAALADRAARVP